jgi:hypothetical protein
LLAHLRRALAPGGVLAVNLVTGAGHRTMQSHTRRVLRDAFPVLRSLTSAAAMNEVLVAGETVASRRRLASHLDAFADWRDREYWQRLAVRRLG